MPLPKEWTTAGAHFGRDGLLYLSEWRRGFTVHELRALFFDCQQVRALRLDLDRAHAELERVVLELEASQKKAAFYRRQCQLEARLGLALTRIAH